MSPEKGVPHGFGRCEYKSGNVFTGSMEYGLMQGKGNSALICPLAIIEDLYNGIC